MKLCLNMIVKNEAARIERALASAVQFIDGYAITDTGSTDDTVGVIERFFKTHHIPGVMSYCTFVDWSQARNHALTRGRMYARHHDLNYLLLMDADMEIKVGDVKAFLGNRAGLSWDMYQEAGSISYQNRRLVHAATEGWYRGVTHEYLDIPSVGCIAPEVAFFKDHADGANRPQKFERDIRLLLADLKTDPTNARSMFYLANSYRDSGEPLSARLWYERRVNAGGWDEEVWQAQVNLAHCYREEGNEAEFIRNLLIAYNMRPSRAESLYDLAHHYRDKSMNAAAVVVADAGVNIPMSTDALFVNKFVYDVGLKEELSICGFYVPGKREEGFRYADELSMAKGPYGGSRELARNNLYHYIVPLAEHCPSFEHKRIAFEPPADWVALNPSITWYDKHGVTSGPSAVCNVRCVNYRIDEHGRYLIRGTDGTANDSNPINTRNFLLYMGADPWSDTKPGVCELLPPGNLPCEFKPVIGFEDVRLFEWKSQLWTSSTVRQIHWDGNCEQVLARVQQCDDDDYAARMVDMHRMLRQPRSTEKNWAPVVQNNLLRFMWRPGELVGIDGVTVKKFETGLSMDHISGSSQLISWPSGWLAVTHEARIIPGKPTRYYTHRFIHYSYDGAVRRISRPFVFEDKQIEFCAGLCWAHDNEHLILSYGSRDCEAKLGRVDYHEVERMLCCPRS